MSDNNPTEKKQDDTNISEVLPYEFLLKAGVPRNEIIDYFLSQWAISRASKQTQPSAEKSEVENNSSLGSIGFRLKHYKKEVPEPIDFGDNEGDNKENNNSQ